MSQLLSSISNPVCAKVREFCESPDKGIEALDIQKQRLPSDANLGPKDVVIKVRSCAVGCVDLLMTSGQYQHMPPLPYTPGLEYSGDIVWIGDDARNSGLSLGDRVYVDGISTGPRSSGDYQKWGGYASCAVTPVEAVRKIPGGLSYDQACQLLGNYETAYHCLVKCGELKSGETILIPGASGSTGLAAVHIAKLLGARVIATGRSDEKLAIVKEQGADHVINCASLDGRSSIRSFRKEVKALTDGFGVDVVYDAVGGDISLESLRCVKFGARFLIVGWAATPFVAKGKGQRGAPNANVLPTNLIMMKGLRVLGCPTVISTQFDPSIRPERLNAILKWVDEGKIQPYVSHRFPFSAVKDAMKAKWQGQVIGGCVVYME